mmetsp:Transcript_6411/g.14024  ORF Transcript_6411/g.14024 Transcript_6411/m.14024 type:complete len:239 (-) Transcript_6411:317-1033(-)
MGTNLQLVPILQGISMNEDIGASILRRYEAIALILPSFDRARLLTSCHWRLRASVLVYHHFAFALAISAATWGREGGLPPALFPVPPSLNIDRSTLHQGVAIGETPSDVDALAHFGDRAAIALVLHPILYPGRLSWQPLIWASTTAAHFATFAIILAVSFGEVFAIAIAFIFAIVFATSFAIVLAVTFAVPISSSAPWIAAVTSLLPTVAAFSFAAGIVSAFGTSPVGPTSVRHASFP